MPNPPRWIRSSIFAAFAVGITLLVLSSSPQAQVLYVTETEVAQDGQVIMHLEPIECEACIPGIESRLNELPSVKSAAIDAHSRTVSIDLTESGVSVDELESVASDTGLIFRSSD
jgi:copper chaperone CopZ